MKCVRLSCVALALTLLGTVVPAQAAGTNALLVAGRTWEGEWSNPRGFCYHASLRFAVADDGAVAGQIVWTLRASPRPSEQAKLGLQGTEFIRGTWSPADGILSFEGITKDDPHGILGLDRYRLALAAPGRLVGVTRNFDPEWGGLFVLDAVPPSSVLVTPAAEEPPHE